MGILNLGGSIVCPGGPDVAYIRAISRSLSDVRPLAIVVGGGAVAREYIEAGEELELGKFYLDKLGISVTYLNAMLLAGSIPDAMVVDSVEDAAALYGVAVPVMGGTEPGHTTDAVSLLLAEAVDEDTVVMATRVGGVYDRDPEKHPEAKILPQVRASELLREAATLGGRPGARFVLDPLSLVIAMRSGIRILVVPPDPEGVRKALLGEEVGGTEVLPD